MKPLSANLEHKKVDLVIIDDNRMFLNALDLLFEDKVVDTYDSPLRFLENLSRYPKDTKICTDNDLCSNANGIDLAKQLHAAGYTHLYLLSGKDFEAGEVPDYLTVIMKMDTDKIQGLV